jgi:hypothetical protein
VVVFRDRDIGGVAMNSVDDLDFAPFKPFSGLALPDPKKRKIGFLVEEKAAA